jgi:hypothetical protein
MAGIGWVLETYHTYQGGCLVYATALICIVTDKNWRYRRPVSIKDEANRRVYRLSWLSTLWWCWIYALLFCIFHIFSLFNLLLFPQFNILFPKHIILISHCRYTYVPTYIYLSPYSIYGFSLPHWYPQIVLTYHTYQGGCLVYATTLICIVTDKNCRYADVQPLFIEWVLDVCIW